MANIEANEHYASIFALQDEFESLYDVELETGKYVFYVKGDFYKNNVIDKLTEPGDYFAELRQNIDSVIYEEDRDALYNTLTRASVVSALKNNDHIDHYYRINTEDGPLWFKIRVVYKDDKKKNIIIGAFNASEEMAAKQRDAEILKNTEEQLRHEQLRSEMLNYMIDYEGDPIELLKQFAEKLLNIIRCDQVIYRDLEETRIMVNSDGIRDTWSVPIEYCKQCEHFNAFHPMYSDGYTEMDDCQKGWRGIPVYHDCPIKSSLTRLVYCDGEISGYLAIHYVQNYHQFTDVERITLEVFTRILSLSLSRYTAKKRAGELDSVKRSLNMMFSLSDQFDPIIVLDPETGEYDWILGKADEVERNTSMSVHGDNIYKNIGIDAAEIIHEDDREQFKAFYTRENMMKIAETGETQEIENRWFLKEFNDYSWKYNKAVRVIDEKGKVRIVIGVVDTTEKRKKEEEIKETYAEMEEALVFTNFFLDTYVSAYYVDFDTLSCRVYKRTSELEKDYPIITNYFDSLSEYINRDVHPEDREKLMELVKPAKMKAMLKKQPEYTQIFRDISNGTEKIYRLQVIRGSEDGRAAFGFMDITSEVTAERKRQVEAEESEKLINSIAASYNAAYSVNMKTDTFRLLRMDSTLKGAGVDFKTFSEARDYFINLLPESDREDMRHELDYGTIRKKLKKKKTYDIEYRIPIAGAIFWHTMNITLIDNDYVAIGFANRDLEITQKHLEDMRYKEYFALYEIDIDTGMMKIVKDSPYYGIDRVGKAMPYKPAMLKFASGLDEEPRAFFEKMADLEYVKQQYATEDKGTYAYRSNNVGDKNWVDCTSYVTYRHKDGTPAMFTFGFSLLDSLGVYRQELQNKYVEQNAVLVLQQEELEVARVAADAANLAKSNFLFNMSHDIRTPMNAIKGFTTMAKKHAADTEKVVEYLNKIDISGQQLLTLINQVLEMARIESGKVELEENPVNIQDEFNATVTVLAEQANTKGLKFTHSLSSVKHSNVLADEARMSSVTMNIVGNAMKYTPEGGSIRLELKEIPARKPGYATFEFTVEDTGIGMSKEYLEELYDPFSREKSSTVSKIQGTGLGMSIVKSTIDLMGGNIDVQSELGKGTTFTITVDFKINENVILEEEADETELVSFKGKRLLLVEDNEMNREIAEDILGEQGLIIESAEDGDIAVDMVKKAFDRGDYKYYDFILMDVQMPRMTGYEATKAIRAMKVPKGVHIPIIAMTANAFEEDRQNALAAGMDEHLAKPIDVPRLFRTIARFL